MARPTLFDIPIDNVSRVEAVARILEFAKREPRDAGSCVQVSFVNADCVNLAEKDSSYRQVLQSSDLVFADGSGMRLAGRCLGLPIADNVNGTDLFPELLAAVPPEGLRVFLLGGQPGIATAVQTWIETHHPRVTVVGVEHGYVDAEGERSVVDRIAASGAQILLVGFGAPRQEQWIRRHRAKLGVAVAIGVGGLFDYYSGRIPRAPRWMRKLGVEWCWRLYQEPRRLARRYLLGNPRFLYRVFRAALTSQRPRLGTARQIPSS